MKKPVNQQVCLFLVPPDRCGTHPIEGGQLAPCKAEGCADYEPRYVKLRKD